MRQMLGEGVPRRVSSLSRVTRAPLNRRQVDTLIAQGVAILGLVFGLQSLPLLIVQYAELRPIWLIAFSILISVSTIAVLVTSALGSWARFTHGVVALVVLLGVATWPLGVVSTAQETAPVHWLSFFLISSVASASVAFPRIVAAAYLLFVPATYAVFRIMLDADGLHATRAVLDGAFSFVLGAVLLVIISMLRSAALAVDVAQEAALERYSEAVRQHAMEVERVRVDAIVHDSVLTTFLSAARASTPEEKSLVGLMASNAIGYLQQAAVASPIESGVVTATAVAHRVVQAAHAASSEVEVRLRTLDDVTLPSGVAEALYSAAVQALVNSVQHAGETGVVARWILVRGLSSSGLEIEVGDTGTGFVPDAVPRERLGLRVSILERVTQMGGEVEIDTQPGEGTVISMRWQRPLGAAQ